MASVKTQVIEQVAALMTAAFGVLAALAWNEAISTLVRKYLDSASGMEPWVGLMIYAVIVTIIAVAASLLIAKAAMKAKAADATVSDKSKAEKK
jgi:hypothetical protein